MDGGGGWDEGSLSLSLDEKAVERNRNVNKETGGQADGRERRLVAGFVGMDRKVRSCA